MFKELNTRVEKAEKAFKKSIETLGDALNSKNEEAIKKCKKIKRTAETKLVNARIAMVAAKKSSSNIMMKVINRVPFKKAAIWTGITAGLTAAAIAGYILYDHMLGGDETDNSDQV